jgi:hypothetical protein
LLPSVSVAAQSFGGFTVPLVVACLPVAVLALLAAMILAPGEAPEDWPANTDFDQVMRQQTQQYAGQDLAVVQERSTAAIHRRPEIADPRGPGTGVVCAGGSPFPVPVRHVSPRMPASPRGAA